MKRIGRGRCELKLEQLEARRVLAAVSGSVWADLNGDSQFNAGDEAVPSALVWIDTNRNGQAEAGEPQTRAAADGSYAFTGLAAGDYEIRMQPTPGFFQTSPTEYFALYRGNNVGLWGLTEIDPETGSVTHRTPAVGGAMYGLIQTVQGEFYGTRFDTDSLYRIDPVSGAQVVVGGTGKELVAGLAYDPVMDKIYTLARETDADVPPLELYEINRQTGQLTRAGTGQGLAGIRFTSAMTFDSVNREVILFDNNLNEFIAYDLNGDARKLSKFDSDVAFYNLSFDGHRFWTFVPGNQFTPLYEVDIAQARLTPVRTLDQAAWGEAADILATNRPHRVHLNSEASEQADLDFLTNRMNITDATLQIDGSSLHLLSADKKLDIDMPLDDAAMPLRFCVGTQASSLVIEQSLASPKAIEIKLSPHDDRLSINALPRVSIRMGSGVDTLVPLGPMELNLPQLAENGSTADVAQLIGVDVVDLSDSDVVTLEVDFASIAALSDSSKLTVIASVEDRVEISAEPWAAMMPVARGERRLHELSIDEVILELDDGLGWHNPLDSLDVNRDGNISPIDALHVINLLNLAGSRSLNAADSSLAQAEYVDSSGDNFVSPIDALLVINAINSRS